MLKLIKTSHIGSFSISMHPFFQDLQTLVFDTLFPLQCLICETPDILLCEPCTLALAGAPGQRCIVCTLPSSFGLTHSRCKTPQRPSGLVSALHYQGPHVAETIIAGKYKSLPGVFPLLTARLTTLLQNDYQHLTEGALLVPLPLSRRRESWRGFNQALLIAETLSENLHIPLLMALRRTKVTRTQKDLKGEMRRQNVAGAFALAPGISVTGKKLLLVDDVVTTGATLREAAKTLLRSGAANVFCLSLAQD
jgi:ComF family protein